MLLVSFLTNHVIFSLFSKFVECDSLWRFFELLLRFIMFLSGINSRCKFLKSFQELSSFSGFYSRSSDSSKNFSNCLERVLAFNKFTLHCSQSLHSACNWVPKPFMHLSNFQCDLAMFCISFTSCFNIISMPYNLAARNANAILDFFSDINAVFNLITSVSNILVSFQFR